MYSGTTLTPLKRFDAWFGAHQKIDRIARRNLAEMMKQAAKDLPNAKEIINFEGLNGPDGIKRKTPAKDEPWHYYNPEDPTDDKIVKLIEAQYGELVQALKTGDRTRAAFEMAWLAHALVDGLTPAHHYPYEEELMKLRGGAGKETRTSAKDKILMPGDTIHERLSNNWKMWGDKGLLATHFAFEWGVAVMISPLRLRQSMPSKAEIQNATDSTLGELFKDQAAEVAALDMYSRFYQFGWTLKLAKVARKQLVPRIVNIVTLAWYKAAIDAGLLETPQKPKTKAGK
jgi:hypothetical protein